MCRRTARRQRRHIGPKFNHRPCGAFLLVHRTRSLSVVLLWPRCYMAQRLGRSVCLSLSHTLTNTHSHWCSPATSKNVLPSPSRAERGLYELVTTVPLFFCWFIDDTCRMWHLRMLSGALVSFFLAFYDETPRRRSRSVLAAVRQRDWTAGRWKRRRRAWMKRDETRQWIFKSNLSTLLLQPAAPLSACLSVSPTHCCTVVEPEAQQEKRRADAHVKLN